MKYILIIPVLLIAVLSLNAQTIERKVIGTAGGHLAPSGGPQLTQNIGETFVATLSGGGYMLTQGFLQPDVPVTPIVNPGTLYVCVGQVIALTDSTPGGVWSSANSSFATVDATSGIVTGVTPSTVTISYTVGGSSVTTVVTVNPLPSTITGATGICLGLTSMLSDVNPGGVWWSSSAAVASIDSNSGMVTANAAGTATISYAFMTGCYTTKEVTVYPGAGSISGVYSVCAGSTTTLGSPDPGGEWSSSNFGVASVSAGGVVSGVTAGLATITYTLPTGCFKTLQMTVNPAGDAGTITPTLSVGQSYGGGIVAYILQPGDPGYSADVEKGLIAATVDQSAGIQWYDNSVYYTVTGATATGIGTGASNTDAIIASQGHFHPYAASICRDYNGGGYSDWYLPSKDELNKLYLNRSLIGGFTTGSFYSSTEASSLNAWLQSFGSGSQYIDGKSVFTNVRAVRSFTAGLTSICEGNSIALNASVPGGTWSSSNLAIVYIGTSGVAIGVTTGTATISYTVSSDCGTSIATTLVTVNPLPTAITGTTTVCVGSITTLANLVTAGQWYSSDMSVATVTNDAYVSGVAVGTAIITYQLPSGCFRTMQMTVNPAVAAGTITGASAGCIGSTISLSSTVTGGTWSSSNTAVATVGSTGIVNSLGSGVAIISYTVTNDCSSATATKPITVDSTAKIPNSGLIAWYPFNSNSNDSSGHGNNLSVFGATLTTDRFGIPNRAYSFNGTSSYMQASSALLTGMVPVTFSFWAKSSSTASMDVLGQSCGTDCGTDARVMLNTGQCGTSGLSFKNPAFFATAPALSVDTSWHHYVLVMGDSSNYSYEKFKFYIDGFLIPVSCGHNWGGWTYDLPNLPFTVGKAGPLGNYFNGALDDIAVYNRALSYNEILHLNNNNIIETSTISGPSKICIASDNSYSDPITGGTWTTSNPAIASVSGSGVVTGNSAGTVIVTYTVNGGCGYAMVKKIVTVEAVPNLGTIAGTNFVNVGASAVLTDSVDGGTWSSSNSSIAPIASATGMLTGAVVGTATLTYSYTSSCGTFTVTKNVTVGNNTTSACIPHNGLVAWYPFNGNAFDSSGNGNVGTAYSVTPATDRFGNANKAYSFNGTSSYIETQTPLLRGMVPVTFSFWAKTSANYSMDVLDQACNADCGNDMRVMLNTGQCSEEGLSFKSPAFFATSPHATADSSWHFYALVMGDSSNFSYANFKFYIDGVKIPVSCDHNWGGWTYDMQNYRFTIGKGYELMGNYFNGVIDDIAIYNRPCPQSEILQLYNNGLSAGTITGSSTVCVSATTTLSDAVSGGTWSSSNTSIATVGSAGAVTGIGVGTVTISYSATSGCGSGVATKVMTVNAAPNAGTITGASFANVGSTITLSNTTSGGTWSSSNTAIATIGSTGVVSGVATGTATISYTVSNSCGSAVAIKEMAVGAIFKVTDDTSICSGDSLLLAASASCFHYLSSSIANPVYTGTGSWSFVNDSLISMYSWSYGLPATIAYGTDTMKRYGYIESTVRKTGSSAFNTVGVATNITLNGAGGYYLMIKEWDGGLLELHNGPNLWSPTVATASVPGISLFDWHKLRLEVTFDGHVKGFLDDTLKIVYSIPGGIPPSGRFGLTATNITYQFKNTSQYYAQGSFLWSTGDTLPVINVSPSATSMYHCTITTNCGTFTDSVNVAVNTINPGVITGGSSVNAGSTITLSNTTLGGTWSSSNPLTATVSAIGVVTGVAVGTAIISYTVGGACGSTTSTKVVTVNSPVSTISGALTVCTGYTSVLTDVTPGGSWSSGNSAIATIASNGTVTGLSAGTSVISYFVAGGYSTAVVTVNSTPSVIGTSVACAGSSSSLHGSISSGTWLSDNSSVATAGLSSGSITAVSAGTANLTYTLATGCYATAIFTVNPLPDAITGTSVICAGTTSNLNNITAGGSWTSTYPTVASINSSGVVAGVSAGVTAITYTLSTGCRTAYSITVNAQPAAISGSTTVCQGTTTSLSCATAGGSWISNDTSVATINSSGIVTSVTPGSATISYIVGTGCSRTAVVTVNATPVVSGTTFVCTGSTTTLTSDIAGGAWGGGSSTVATVSGGVVTGLGSGITNILYTLGSGCRAVVAVTGNPLPANITGTFKLCPGATTTLASLTTGGTWSTANTSIATIDASRVITGVVPGTTTVSYTLGTGCARTATITVNTLPADNTGTSAICMGATTTLANTSSVLSWTSSNTAIATVTSGGIVTGMGVGVAAITFTASGTGCIATTFVTVHAVPTAITGSAAGCVGATGPLGNTVAGGLWSSGNTAVATIDAATGLVTGITPGTATITYSANGCASVATKVLTINTSPVAGTLSGPATITVGNTASYSSTIGGGVWSSGNTAIATIGSTGIVSAVSAGSVLISYSVSNNCGTDVATITVAVVPHAAPITGSLAACIGQTSTLSDTTPGGTWSSTNTAIATISPLGVVSGLSSGVAIISYITPVGYATAIVTISATPAINGTPSVCMGATATLSTNITGGTWNSGNASVVSVGTSGVITGVSAGTTSISYTAPSGCKNTVTASANATPGSITGPSVICAGTTASLTNSVPGGTWTSTFTSVATVGSITGVLTGISAGSSNITYAAPGGCKAIALVSVNTLPAAITGTTNTCEGAATTLACSTTAGTWSSGNTVTASVGSTGIVTGISSGTAPISYAIGNGCSRIVTYNVNAMPSIGGAPVICPGTTATLTASITGGSWTGGSSIIATVGNTTGIVSGIGAGATAISYSMSSTGCKTGVIVTVGPVPASITGTTKTCPGLTTTLSILTTGGTWSSSNTAIATVSSNGVVTGIAAGTVNISYTVSSGCSKSVIITINPAPSAIAGTTSFCIASAATLSDASSGGTWSSGNTGVVTINSGCGAMTGVSPGVANITYTMVNGCIAIAIVTVASTPGAISGPSSGCLGTSILLTESVSGGVWSSSNTSVATIDPAIGLVSGVSTGIANITYSMGGSCYQVKAITMNSASGGTITGNATICVGSTNTLNAWGPGTWSSSNSAVAATPMPSGGAIAGVSTGTANITFTLQSNGCFVAYPVTVVNPPAAITGTSAICSGTTTIFANTATGGAWSSGNIATATVDASTGVVSAVGSAGTVLITYAYSITCYATKLLTVNAIPAPIAGTFSICATGATTLTDAATGGVWSSSNISVAGVGSVASPGTAVVTGVSAGIASISYLFPTGCMRTTTVTVNACSRQGGSEEVPIDFELYPNPATARFTIATGDAGILRLIDVTGVELCFYRMVKGINSVTLSKNIAGGIYVCEFIAENGQVQRVKLVYEP